MAMPAELAAPVAVVSATVVIEATQWFKNGDHPDDEVGGSAIDKATGEHAEYKGVKKYSYSIRFPKKGETIPDADKPKGGEAIEF